jgi:hypothetical protein
MAGNWRSGRRTTCAGPRPRREGKPLRPDGLNEREAEFWATVIDTAAHLEAQDGPLCVAAARCWSLYQLALDAAEGNPMDAAARCAVVSYGAALARWATLLQLDVLGRQRASGTKDDLEEDPLKEFGIVG